MSGCSVPYQEVTGTPGTAGADGQSAYIYVRYAADAIGTDFSDTPSIGRKFIAVKNSTTAIASPIAADFTGLWAKYLGDDGAPGSTEDVVSATTSGSTVVVNPATAWVHRMTLAHNVSTLTITKPTAMATQSRLFILVLKQGTAGQNTFTLPNSVGSYVNIVLPGNVAPAAATGTDGIETELWFRWDGVKDKFVFCNYVGNV